MYDYYSAIICESSMYELMWSKATKQESIKFQQKVLCTRWSDCYSCNSVARFKISKLFFIINHSVEEEWLCDQYLKSMQYLQNGGIFVVQLKHKIKSRWTIQQILKLKWCYYLELFQYPQVTHAGMANVWQLSTQCPISRLSLLPQYGLQHSLVLFCMRVVCKQLFGSHISRT